jgi:hypothetical protein
MKLYARLVTLDEQGIAMLKALLPPGGPSVVSCRYAVDVLDPALETILRAGETRKGFSVSGETVLTDAELAGVTHFELASRFVVRESAADSAANDDVRAKTPLVDAGGERPVRLMRGLFLSRISLKPNMVGSVGDWTNEHVAAAGVMEVLTAGRLTGVEFVPVHHPKTRAAHPGAGQLFSEALLTPAVVDASVDRVRSHASEEDGTLRQMGCLAYEPGALCDRPDFNRTCEPWAGWHGWPAWVVSARVKEVCTRSRLRGWHFRPVLTTDMPIYAQYADAWQALRSAVSATQCSRLDGGRW